MATGRYFIAIIPPSPLVEELQELKNYFKRKYQSKAALNSPPHITLRMPFLWEEEREHDLNSLLQNFATNHKPIAIELLNFSSFPPKVIFVNVSANEELNRLQQNLQQLCKTKLNLEHDDHPYHPHLTLAFRDLKKSMFEAAINECRDKAFSSTFIADKITLLKRDGKVWRPFTHFHF